GLPGMTMLLAGNGLTVTPPDTVAVMWFANPGPPVSGPGSKNSGHVPPPVQRPFVQVGAVQLSVPVIVEVAEACPVQTAVAVGGTGGGGGLSGALRASR